MPASDTWFGQVCGRGVAGAPTGGQTGPVTEERPLVLAVIEACLLLELCADEIGADRAVGAAADLHRHLAGLRHDDQVELRAQLAEVAEDTTDPGYAAFVAGLADRFGLDRPRSGAHLSWR